MPTLIPLLLLLLALAACSRPEPVRSVITADGLAITCQSAIPLAADRCLLYGESAQAKIPEGRQRATAIAVLVSARDGVCQRAGATPFDRDGLALGSVSLACSSH